MPPVSHTAQLPALLVGLEIEFLAGIHEPVGRKRQIGLDAAFRHRLRRSLGVVVQIGHGGDAEAQALGNAQKGSSLGAAGIHLILPDQLLLQRLPAGGIVSKAAQHRGGQMGMAVHQAGHRHHAGAIHNRSRLLGRRLFSNIGYFTIGHAQICTKQHIHALIHGHDRYIRDQGIQMNTSFLRSAERSKCTIAISPPATVHNVGATIGRPLVLHRIGRTSDARPYESIQKQSDKFEFMRKKGCPMAALWVNINLLMPAPEGTDPAWSHEAKA